MLGKWTKHEPTASVAVRRLQMLTLRLARVEMVKQVQRAHVVMTALTRKPNGK